MSGCVSGMGVAVEEARREGSARPSRAPRRDVRRVRGHPWEEFTIRNSKRATRLTLPRVAPVCARGMRTADEADEQDEEGYRSGGGAAEARVR
jgi:hypothetical protein